MITISPTAQEHFIKLLAQQAEGTHIRVFVVNPGTAKAECGVSYCPADAVEANDIELPFEGFSAMVDADSKGFLEEAEIDFVTDQMGSQLAGHGGECTLIEITDDGYVILQFGGGCNGCSQIDVTVKDGIEKQLVDIMGDEIKGVRDITEHERGDHSYY